MRSHTGNMNFNCLPLKKKKEETAANRSKVNSGQIYFRTM